MKAQRNGSNGLWSVNHPDLGFLGYAERQPKHCGRHWYTALVPTADPDAPCVPLGQHSGYGATLFSSLSTARHALLDRARKKAAAHG